MYWGKKVIEWTANPEEAFRILLYLNNKYELDGRDPNSFTGVAWCFGKVGTVVVVVEILFVTTFSVVSMIELIWNVPLLES